MRYLCEKKIELYFVYCTIVYVILKMSDTTELPYDDETSSDDEYDDTEYPYNMYKPGREYIYLSSKYAILVPAIEFRKVYGKTLETLKKECKRIKVINDTLTNYIFDTSQYKMYPKKDFEKLDDKEKAIRQLVNSFESGIETYADDAPHRCGHYCNLADTWSGGNDVVKKNKPWYKESVGNYAMSSCDIGTVYVPLEETVKQHDCSIVEMYSFARYSW